MTTHNHIISDEWKAQHQFVLNIRETLQSQNNDCQGKKSKKNFFCQTLAYLFNSFNHCLVIFAYYTLWMWHSFLFNCTAWNGLVMLQNRVSKITPTHFVAKLFGVNWIRRILVLSKMTHFATIGIINQNYCLNFFDNQKVVCIKGIPTRRFSSVF